MTTPRIISAIAEYEHISTEERIYNIIMEKFSKYNLTGENAINCDELFTNLSIIVEYFDYQIIKNLTDVPPWALDNFIRALAQEMIPALQKAGILIEACKYLAATDLFGADKISAGNEITDIDSSRLSVLSKSYAKLANINMLTYKLFIALLKPELQFWHVTNWLCNLKNSDYYRDAIPIVLNNLSLLQDHTSCKLLQIFDEIPQYRSKLQKLGIDISKKELYTELDNYCKSNLEDDLSKFFNYADELYLPSCVPTCRIC